MTDTKLMPCPFCGVKAEIWPWHCPTPKSFAIGCNNGACKFNPWGAFSRKGEGIKAWNTRPAPQVTDDVREAIAVIEGWLPLVEKKTDADKSGFQLYAHDAPEIKIVIQAALHPVAQMMDEAEEHALKLIKQHGFNDSLIKPIADLIIKAALRHAQTVDREVVGEIEDELISAINELDDAGPKAAKYAVQHIRKALSILEKKGGAK